MKIEDIKIGMRVRLLDKTRGDHGLTNSVIYNRMLEINQDYAYVVRIDYNKIHPERSIIIIGNYSDSSNGDFFYCTDLELDTKRERKDKLNKICSLKD
jgi:hypothetical protein